VGVLFGTDGVREVANTRLTPELAFRLGRAGAAVAVRRSGGRSLMVVGGDTRRSTGMLEAAAVAGITSVGVDAARAGVVPTPAVAYLTRALGASAGVVVSASHNPAEYNGIKFFGPDGFKLADELEEEIEAGAMAAGGGDMGAATWGEADGLPRPHGAGVGVVSDIVDAVDMYVRFAAGVARRRLDGLHIVIDCANGASFRTSPAAFRALGAKTTVINDSPDGDNINVRCGSTHPEALQEAVRELGADLGFAHDGDADRVMGVDSDGNVVDGDQIMAVCSAFRAANGGLPGRAIVATQYSNLGLVQALRAIGCQVIMANAGDKYVLQEMRRRGLALGGEQSGHIIMLEKTTTGDGLITAIEVAAIVAATGKPLSELASVMVKFPQILVNVRVSRKDEYGASAAIRAAVEGAQAELGDAARLVVRPSGTEPVVRVMGEGPDQAVVRKVVEGVAGVIRAELA
jgi:phosphoglucosamine mutase